MFSLLTTLKALDVYGEQKHRQMAKTVQDEWGIPIGDDWNV